MGRLKSALLSKNHDKKLKVKIYNPKNCETLKIPFKSDKIAKVVGKLASLPPPSKKSTSSAMVKHRQTTLDELDGHIISGVLVQNDFKISLMAPEDLREYAGLTTTIVTCRQRVQTVAAGTGMVRWAMEGMFGAVVELPDEELAKAGKKGGKPGGKEEEKNVTGNTFRVMDCVTLRCRRGYVEVEWEGNVLNDGIADGIVACLLMLESSPAAVKCTFPSPPTLRRDNAEPV